MSLKAKRRALVVASGGLDSTVALYWALGRYARAEAVTFDYGANHNRMERRALRRICREAGVPLTVVRLPLKGLFESALLGGEIPDGAYAESNMKSTVVPFRNGIMLALAAGLAESREIDDVILGNHGGDHFLYPDCRADFIAAMTEAVKRGTIAGVRVVSPFCTETKADIVRRGLRLGAPLALTYSCYKGGTYHCGVCGTCRERREAFSSAGVADPTRYADCRISGLKISQNTPLCVGTKK